MVIYNRPTKPFSIFVVSFVPRLFSREPALHIYSIETARVEKKFTHHVIRHLTYLLYNIIYDTLYNIIYDTAVPFCPSPSSELVNNKYLVLYY